MMILGTLFLAGGIWFGYNYFFGTQKLSLAYLLLSLWSVACAVSQLRLSPYENAWSLKFYGILALFFIVFYFAYTWFIKVWNKKIVASSDTYVNNKFLLWIIGALAVASIACNAYIYARFGTLPILSTVPDKMRFIINKEIFGLWEYLALAPRFFIPLTFIYLLTNVATSTWKKILAWFIIAVGFLILSLYASRLIIVFAIVMCYFSYLILRIKEIGFKKIVLASGLAVFLVLSISIIIPVVRQHITYRDYYLHEEDDAFSYIADLSNLRVPKSLRFITPLYIVPSFNTQSLMRSTDFYTWPHFYFGAYELSVFNPLLKIIHVPQINITIPWKQIFLPWWITGTFLFSYWVDFGYVGIVGAGLLWAALLSGIYVWAVRRPTPMALLMFSYFSFVIIMSLYTNYFMRQEFFMDVVLLLIIGNIINKDKITIKLWKKNSPSV